MAANQLDWFPVYVGLWQGESVKCLSLAAQGAYMACITAQFREGTIPADLSRLARVIGADRTELESVWPEIADKFTEVEPGRLANAKMSEVRDEQEQKRQIARANASKGGKATAKANAEATAQATAQADATADGEATAQAGAEPNAQAIREEKNRIDNTDTDVSEADASSDAKPYEEVNAVLVQVAERLEWKPPTPTDVRKHLKPDSNIRLMIQEGSISETVEIFIYAYENWNQSPTWSSVFGQRNQLRDQMKGKVKQGGKPPAPTGPVYRTATDEELRRAMR